MELYIPYDINLIQSFEEKGENEKFKEYYDLQRNGVFKFGNILGIVT